MVTECALVERASLHVCHRGNSADGVADQLHSPAADGKSSSNKKVGQRVESTLVQCRVLQQLELQIVRFLGARILNDLRNKNIMLFSMPIFTFQFSSRG